MKLLFVCLLFGVISVCQLDARGIEDETDQRSCLAICREKYPNGEKGLIALCIRICKMERGVVTVNPTGFPENPTGVEEERNRQCFIACHDKYMHGPQALLDRCNRLCENPTGVEEETSPCWDKCHMQYPDGPPGLVDACIRRCGWGNGLAENSAVPEYVVQYVKDEFHLENTLPDTRTCSEICREKYPMAGPIVLKVCIDICDMAKGTTLPDFTVKPITNSPVIALGSDKECKLIDL